MSTEPEAAPSAEQLELPLLPRRDTVVFPKLLSQLMVMRPSFQHALEAAISNDHKIVVLARKNAHQTEFGVEDLYSVGTMATVGRLLKLPDGSANVWLQGETRVKILEVSQTEPFYKAKVLPIIDEEPDDSLNLQALMRAVLALFEKAVQLSSNLSDEMYIAAMNADEPGWLADLICSALNLDLEKRQDILEVLNVEERLKAVNLHLAREVEVLEIQTRISSQVQDEMEKSHREYFLREQMRAIQKELAEVDPQLNEMETLQKKIDESGMPEEAAKKANQELQRLGYIPSASPENGVVRGYVDWLLALPWKTQTEDNLDIRNAAQILDQNHFGLPKVKERILEFMAVRKLSEGKLRSPILCFVGPPGVGKTSLGRSIALALGRKFVRMSLGGIRDEAEIRGHRRTYVGALPGRILQTMRTAGTINPLFMLDEIDKVGTDFRGDPSSALLEVLDPEQNNAFSDHFLEVPYDLSKVLFITTGNLLDPILPSLRDRMEIIELAGYTEEEKMQIARLFLIPKQLREHGLAANQLHFPPNAVRRITREYTREAGVRNLEREIGSICRKVAKRVAEEKKAPGTVPSHLIARYLGSPRFSWGMAEERDEIGVATGVARTEAGGDVLSVEVTLMVGKGNLILTGQLGDVMKESAQAAVSYSRSRSQAWKLSKEFFNTRDIHIHIPAGAIPKDGPSAGVTMTTALVSSLTQQPVRKDVAMTGEVTLRGRVLPVGGVKEKVLAAHRAGITTFVLPSQNRKDLSDIPSKVRRAFNFVFVKQMEEVLSAALRNDTVSK